MDSPQGSGGAGKGVAQKPPLKGIARTTGRPRLRSPNGVAQARALLSSAEVVEQLRLDPEALEALRRCCTSRPPRNAGAIVAAIRTRLEWSQAKPTQTVEHQGHVTFEVVDPYARRTLTLPGGGS